MKNQNISKKVILAFSGGLDTSFCVLYLIEKGFDVITATVDSGGFSSDELKSIEEKSKALGAKKHYQIDYKKQYFNSVIKWIIMTNGLYEGSYPNIVSSQRYGIVEKCIEIANLEKAQYVANGNSGMGNDQVRFNIPLKILAPDITLIEPIKDMGGNREEEKKYLKKNGFVIGDSNKKYSINVNLLGITYSGSEIDQNLELDQNIFQWVTGKYVNKKTYFEIVFDKGTPIKLNGKKLEGFKILQILNHEVGKYGFGKGYYTGDCMIGIKGHLVFEAPGILFLIKAHLALEQYVLSKQQIYFGELVSKEMTENIFNGKFYDPYIDSLKAFIKKNQKNVSGKVVMKIEHGNALPVSVKSKYSLIDPKIAMYAQSKTWTKQEVDGFIKLYGLQSIIASKINKKGGEML
ncbi:MAG: Argininosuccinate synthase [Candidatus Roizmanbacteria bacterium GW2011_GWA2_35_19]|uniref:argininosuccinate synthase n=2 Tax=Candidatus Roizmaniibacteriota TaxID=1752723 RepID=A0A0G0F2Z5_9BACT|nr:MAG: Argininosuccinate synthase [Candidatus Roizmanbacteria bacterium GW2011_GWC2_35_12]KKP73762.1 MAG: Argininosuccinate synthase [Candidatus Roizmanbacteria bacterium GW2011_GWA2_35_19]